MQGTVDLPAAPHQRPLPGISEDPIFHTVRLGSRVTLRDDPKLRWRVILVGDIPLMSFSWDDRLSMRFACVRLRLDGLVEQQELAWVFGHERTTQYRWEQRFLKDGLEGLRLYRPAGRSPSTGKRTEELVVRLHEQGLGMRRIASRLALSIGVVRRLYAHYGLAPQHAGEQGVLIEHDEEESTSLEEAEVSQSETEKKGVQETDIAQGEEESKDDPAPEGLALPEFSFATGVPRAGVLLAIPILSRLRIIETFRRIYGQLGIIPVYGLEVVVTALLFFSLWRIKRVDQLTRFSAEELGRPLGLPRVPEVKTVRRKLAQLAARERAREVMVELARVRLQQEEDLLGTLYIDGHVRPYSGKYNLAKGYSAQRHVATRATTDVWVSDRKADPLFVVTCEINEGLTQKLEDALLQARELAGKRPVTVVFDRGGWSASLFARLLDKGFHLITYRKGAVAEVPRNAFRQVSFEAEGGKVEYWLHERKKVAISAEAVEWSDGERRPVRLRQITRLTPETGHQTVVVTSRRDLPAQEVLWRLFSRWRQENFFKYMREEFAIDGLVEYGQLPVDPKLDRPNPEHLALSEEIKGLKARIGRLQSARCELIGEESEKQEPAGWVKFVPEKAKRDKLLLEIRSLKRQMAELEQRRRELPERISAGDLERLRFERKLLSDVVKMAAYQIETELTRLLAPHYARNDDEGHRLIAAALASPADIEVDGSTLKVTLSPQSSPHRSRAIAALAEELNKLGGLFPATSLRVVLDCALNPPDVASDKR